MTEPIDHLAGKTGNTTELLRELTDEQLRETGAYWAKREAEYRAAEQNGRNAYSAWWCSKKRSAIGNVLADRHHYDGWSTQFTTSHPCYVCGNESIAVEDEGWVCIVHSHRSLDGLVSAAERDGAGESIPSEG